MLPRETTTPQLPSESPLMHGYAALNEYLDKQSPDGQLIIVSFFVTNPVTLSKLKAQWALRNAEHTTVLGRITKDIEILQDEDFGGTIALINPMQLETGFLAELPVPSAFGLCVRKSENSLYVTSNTILTKIKGGQCIRTFDNSLFNDLHTCASSLAGNLLVVSTGVDAVLEVDFDDASLVYWDWIAPEHGYKTAASGGTRYIDRNFNYQSLVTTTPEHTTHINTAINDQQNRVLATLFHQGEIIEIDIPSKSSRVVLSGLKAPHNIRRRNHGFMVSDTRANRVLLLDEAFGIESEIKCGFDWVQDALELADYSAYVVADSNNDRIMLLDSSGNQMAALHWAKASRKVAALENITVAQAKDIFLPHDVASDAE